MSSWLKCQWCTRWEYSNSASCDHSTMDRNTRETNGGHSWCNNNKKNKNNVLPSLDFFFRTRVPPNFPRKDSSFLIFADCVVADGVPDIFECLWCVRGLSLSLCLYRPCHSSLWCIQAPVYNPITAKWHQTGRHQTGGRGSAWAS